MKRDYSSFTIGMLVLPLGLVGLGVALASSVSTPNTFVGGTTAVAAEVNANFAAHEAAINDNDARIDADALGRSVITYNGILNFSPTVDFTYEKAKVLGFFTKMRAGTDIKLTWNSHVDHDGGFANCQLRVNDVAGGDGSVGAGALVWGGSRVPANTWVIFQGLPAGVHEVSLWIRSTAVTTVRENDGNYSRQVLVEEQAAQ